MLFQGTLLGAMRNNDIIAWTADADILIPRDLAQLLGGDPTPHTQALHDALFDAGIYTFLGAGILFAFVTMSARRRLVRAARAH